jgi:hypothetical protein
MNRQDEKGPQGERSGLSQQTRTRRNVEKVNRLDSRSAPGMGGTPNQGPSWISENSGKIMIVIAIIIVAGAIYMELNGDFS